MSRKRIYLASPLGFAESTRAFMESLIPLLEAHVDVENPWDDVRFAGDLAAIARIDSVAERHRRLGDINREIGLTNTTRIDGSDGVFAILDGVDVDSGTAAEVGYAFAMSKRVCGLRTDFRLAGDNAGAIVNLQVEYFILASGGSIVTKPEELLHIAQEFSAGDQPIKP